MSENMERRVGYEVVVEEIAPEAPDGVRLRAEVFEIYERNHEQRKYRLRLGDGYEVTWSSSDGEVKPLPGHADEAVFHPEHRKHDDEALTTRDGHHEARVTASLVHEGQTVCTSPPYRLSAAGGGGPPRRPREPVPVRLTRAAHGSTRDLILSQAIRYSTNSIKFDNYTRFLDYVLGGNDDALPSPNDFLSTDDRGVFTVGERVVEHERHARKEMKGEMARLRARGNRLLTGTGAYKLLREATDWFLRVYCGVLPPAHDFARIEADLEDRVGATLHADSVKHAWDAYTVRVNGGRVLPYLNIVRQRVREDGLGARTAGYGRDGDDLQLEGVIEEKLEHPCFVELIWSYWQEEGMLVQTINAIANRFQNLRGPRGDRDPLTNLEITTLRPLNNLLWGYVQKDLSRLSVARRAQEYQHQYGLGLEGRAVAHLRPADRRTKFVEAFHNFLHRCLRFYEQDDDMTVNADGFPVLNAIKEVHYLLAEAAQNQFGNLATTARGEMLIQQWLLARPEMRQFLGGRPAVPYPEPWMDIVDSMKALQGWTDTSVVHFNDLATFGEQIVLGLRYGAWSIVTNPNAAANFAREWRAEIQGYECAYRAVTGVELGAEITTQQAASERNLPPSLHLKRRLLARREA